MDRGRTCRDSGGRAIMSRMSMNERVTIITGAGRGIGRATALHFARAGARVILFSRTASQIEAAVAEITSASGQALGVVGDVSREEDVHALFENAVGHYGRVDVLLNCAGIVAVQPFVEMDVKTWDSVIDVNLRGTFLCCREAFQIMAAQR